MKIYGRASALPILLIGAIYELTVFGSHII